MEWASSKCLVLSLNDHLAKREMTTLRRDKSGQKHTGVQSSWEKGSKTNALGSQHDSYGIVSVKGVQKHSGVQSAWEKGSNENNLSSAHDSYGIVSVKGTDKHSGVQSTWEKGSNQTNVGSGHDSAGVIRQPE